MKKSISVVVGLLIALLFTGAFAQPTPAQPVLTSVTPTVVGSGGDPPPDPPEEPMGWAVGVPYPGDWFLATAGSITNVSTGGGNRTFNGTGTAEDPVIYQGVSTPTFTGTVTISGSYVIVDSILVNGGVVRFAGDHLTLRNSEVTNNNGGISDATISTSGVSSYLVVYNNEIHDNGDWTSVVENDVHGVTVSGSNPVTHFWVINNLMYHHQGDSVQVGHNHNNSSSGIYVAQNEMYQDKENAVDVKEVTNFIIAENYMHGYRASPSSEGAAVVIHYCPINSSIINNLIVDNQVGIRSTALNSSCTGEYVRNIISGNVVDTTIGAGIEGWGSGKDTIIVNNTLVDIGGVGIDITNGTAGSYIRNNILRNVTGTAIVAAGVSASNNLTTDPSFVNYSTADYHLQSGSSARDTGTSIAAFTDYFSVFGVSIAVDRSGIARPQNGTMDIGAYEYTP